MAYDSTTGLWTPDPGSTTADKVTGMLSASNPYVQQAKQQGVDYANSRGVQNSSIAAGASQKAAYNAVVPIATNDANIAAQKDLSAQTYAQNDILSGKQIASTEKIAADQNATQLAAANLSAATQTNIAGMNIDAAAKQQAAQILSQQKIAGEQIQSQADLAKLASDTQTAIANLNISDADKQQLLNIAAQERQTASTQATQLQIANMNVSSNEQDKAQAAAVSYANVYGSMVNAINSNKDIPADARAAYLQNAKDLYDNGMKVVEQTYNVQLDWGQNGGGAATPAVTSSTGATNTAFGGFTAPPNNYAQGNGANDPYGSNPSDYNVVTYTDRSGNMFNRYGNWLGQNS